MTSLFKFKFRILYDKKKVYLYVHFFFFHRLVALMLSLKADDKALSTQGLSNKQRM